MIDMLLLFLFLLDLLSISGAEWKIEGCLGGSVTSQRFSCRVLCLRL